MAYTYQKQELLMVTMFLSNRVKMRKSYRGPSIDASCKILLYLAKQFQRGRCEGKKITDECRQVMSKAAILLS
jgi:hypothetical protein